MERKFELKLVNPDHHWMKGIYIIRIGRMKYVGKALLIGERMKQHQDMINRVLKRFSEFINLGVPYVSLSSYLRIGRYLLENPQISSGTVEVIERQVCSNALYYSENIYLMDIGRNPDFYNISWYGSKPKENEKNLWDVIVGDNGLEYFDRRIAHIKINPAKGIKYNEQYLKLIDDYKKSGAYRRLLLKEWHDSIQSENNSLETRKAIVEYMMRELSKISQS